LPADGHVQSTVRPLPFAEATVWPVVSATVTVHASTPERRAWKRTSPPNAPATVGA
jgi:hypothetical protein